MQHSITQSIACGSTECIQCISPSSQQTLRPGLGHFSRGHLGRGHYGRGHLGRGHYGRCHFGRGHLGRGHFGPLI